MTALTHQDGASKRADLKSPTSTFFLDEENTVLISILIEQHELAISDPSSSPIPSKGPDNKKTSAVGNSQAYTKKQPIKAVYRAAISTTPQKPSA